MFTCSLLRAGVAGAVSSARVTRDLCAQPLPSEEFLQHYRFLSIVSLDPCSLIFCSYMLYKYMHFFHVGIYSSLYLPLVYGVRYVSNYMNSYIYLYVYLFIIYLRTYCLCTVCVCKAYVYVFIHTLTMVCIHVQLSFWVSLSLHLITFFLSYTFNNLCKRYLHRSQVYMILIS